MTSGTNPMDVLKHDRKNPYSRSCLGIAKRFLALRRHMVSNLYKSYKGIARYHSKIPRTPLFDNVFCFGMVKNILSPVSIGWLSRSHESIIRA